MLFAVPRAIYCVVAIRSSKPRTFSSAIPKLRFQVSVKKIPARGAVAVLPSNARCLDEKRGLKCERGRRAAPPFVYSLLCIPAGANLLTIRL